MEERDLVQLQTCNSLLRACSPSLNSPFAWAICYQFSNPYSALQKVTFSDRSGRSDQSLCQGYAPYQTKWKLRSILPIPKIFLPTFLHTSRLVQITLYYHHTPYSPIHIVEVAVFMEAQWYILVFSLPQLERHAHFPFPSSSKRVSSYPRFGGCSPDWKEWVLQLSAFVQWPIFLLPFQQNACTRKINPKL